MMLRAKRQRRHLVEPLRRERRRLRDQLIQPADLAGVGDVRDHVRLNQALQAS